MVFILKNNKAQSILEYAVLLCALCAAFVAMYVYMRRSVNARVWMLQTQLVNAMK